MNFLWGSLELFFLNVIPFSFTPYCQFYVILKKLYKELLVQLKIFSYFLFLHQLPAARNG